MNKGGIRTFILVLCLAVTLSLTATAVSEGSDAEEIPNYYAATELELREAIEDSAPGDTVEITADITLTDPFPDWPGGQSPSYPASHSSQYGLIRASLSIEAGKDVTIKGDYKITGTVERMYVISIYDGGRLTLDGPTITMLDGLNGTGVSSGIMSTMGHFHLKSGEICNNSAGGVLIGSGTFLMTGGKVHDNGDSEDFFGGILIGGNHWQGADAVIEGGEIYNNISGYEVGRGGGIYVYPTASLKMSGGDVHHNKGVQGGGIYIDSAEPTVSGVKKTSEITGGKIHDNTAEYGGGLWFGNFSRDAGRLSVSGTAEIYENTADYGGGIYSYNKSYDLTLEISGKAHIHDNTATVYGGGIMSHGRVLEMSGGTVSDNTANSFGGGIFNDTGHLFSMTGGTVSGNGAPRAGGIYNGGTLNLSGGTVSLNGAALGGGIYNGSTAALSMTGGAISLNGATYSGGGIYGGTVDITGGTISGNIAAMENGGGIYGDLNKITVGPDAVFSGNTAAAGYDRDPSDDALYESKIKGTKWSSPFTQGYNNYDISYTKGTQVAVVTFMQNHGDEDETVIGSVSVSPGGTIGGEMPADPVRDGHVFGGWNTERDGSGTSYDETTVITGSVTLYALWSAKEYSVIYDLDGGTADASFSAAITITWDGTGLIPAGTFTRDGYTFAGWKLTARDDTAVSPAEDIPAGATYGSLAGSYDTGSVTLTAQWVQVSSPPSADGGCKVTYDGNGNTSGTAPADHRGYSKGDIVVTMGPGTLDKAGHRFAGWSPDKDASSPAYAAGDTFRITGNTVLYAIWYTSTGSETDDIAVTFVDMDDTVLKVEHVPYGGSASAPEPPVHPGYLFIGWDRSFDSVTEDITVRALYEIEVLAHGESRWAVLNLVFAFLGAVSAVIAAVICAKRRDGYGEEDATLPEGEKDASGRRRYVWPAIAIVSAAAGTILFILTEDMSLPMTVADKWTVVNAILFVAAAAAAVLAAAGGYCRVVSEEPALDGKDGARRKHPYVFTLTDGYSGEMSYRIGTGGERKTILPDGNGVYTIPGDEIIRTVFIEAHT